MSVVPLTITAHIEQQGDVTVSAPQQYVGTKGQSRRVEGFTIQSPPGIDLEYMAHLEVQGDTSWSRNGQFVGTKGMSRRLEGFAVRVVGPSSSYYDVKYYAHVAGVGDTGVSANGTFVGSRGQSRRVEGLAVWLETKAQAYSAPAYTPTASPYMPNAGYAPYPAPAPYTPAPYSPSPAPYPAPYSPQTYNPVNYAPPPTYTPIPAFGNAGSYPSYPAVPPPLTVTAFIEYQGPTTVQGQSYAGTKNQSKKMEAFSISHSVPGLIIEYMAHIENIGDTRWHTNGQQLGHQNGGRIEGFSVRLSGAPSNQWDVKYYGHLEGTGDTPVQSNGSFCGSKGQSRRCEGLAVWLEPKRY